MMWITRTIFAVIFAALSIIMFVIGEFSEGITDLLIAVLMAELAVRDYIDKEAK